MWPKTNCIGKRRKREERKKEREKEKRIKEERRKKENKRERKSKTGGKRLGEAIRNEKKYGGVSSDSIYFKSLDFPWNLSV